MRRLLLTILFLSHCAWSEENILRDLHLRIHGNVAEGVMYGSGNNYLGANTKDGTAKWDEGSLNVMSAVSDRFRVGAQVHTWLLGAFGRQNIALDWAYADYQIRPWFGIRAGQVKTPLGLYNDVQDVDVVTQWALLPQPMYPSDMRSFTLSHTGGVLYGDIGLGKQRGTLSWSAFGGRRSQRRNEGFIVAMSSIGIAIGDCRGPMAGADVRWKTPLNGLLVGAAYSRTDMSAPRAAIGPMSFPLAANYRQEHLYSQYEKGKFAISAEWRRAPVHLEMAPILSRDTPTRSWYVMATYRATSKLAVGSYYDQNRLLTPGSNSSSPSNYLKDVTANLRYDFNRFFYAKVEGHYMDGNSLGFYQETNPVGYQRVTRLMLARVGFTF